MTNTTYVTDMHDKHSMGDKCKHDIHNNMYDNRRYSQNIIKVIFKLSIPFVAYSLIAISTIVTAK